MNPEQARLVLLFLNVTLFLPAVLCAAHFADVSWTSAEWSVIDVRRRLAFILPLLFKALKCVFLSANPRNHTSGSVPDHLQHNPQSQLTSGSLLPTYPLVCFAYHLHLLIFSRLPITALLCS